MPRIGSNIIAFSALRHLNRADERFGKSAQRLSSGIRILNAADDPSGLALAKKLEAQVEGLRQATRNAQDAISLVQTAEGALQEQNSLLIEIRNLALASANSAVVDNQTIAANQASVDQAVDSITRIANTTRFAGKKLLDGSGGNQGTVVNSAVLTSVTVGSTAPAGTNLVDVVHTTAATQAIVTGDVDRSSATSGGPHTVNVNGVDITIANGSDIASVVATLNAAFTSNSLDLTAVHDGTNVDIRHNQYGSAFNVSVNDASNILFSSSFNTDAGSDTVGTINGEAATGAGLNLTADAGTAYAGTVVTLVAGAATGAHTNAFQVIQGQLNFHIGSEAGDAVTASIGDLRAAALGTTAGGATGLNSVKTGGTFDLATDATGALGVIDEAIADVSNERANLGAIQRNVFETSINSLGVAEENVEASRSRVEDVDVAAETSEFTKQQILLQAATAVLAQANVAPQSVLTLLG